jgi:4-hydroxy-tetrahydrodipicolinate synthase
VLDMGGTGGILVASHLVGEEMRRMIDEPEQRAAIEQSLLPVYAALGVAPAAVSVKAALRILGLPSGTVRLPYVDLTQDQESALRTALADQGLLQEVSP